MAAKGAGVSCQLDGDHLAVVGENGKALIFPALRIAGNAPGEGCEATVVTVKAWSARRSRCSTPKSGAAWVPTAAGRNREWPDWRRLDRPARRVGKALFRKASRPPNGFQPR